MVTKNQAVASLALVTVAALTGGVGAALGGATAAAGTAAGTALGGALTQAAIDGAGETIAQLIGLNDFFRTGVFLVF